MKNRIVVVTEYFYPVHRNDSYLITKITEAFSQINQNVDVICTSGLNNKKELTTISGKIHRLKNISFKSNNIFIRVLKLVYLTLKLILKSIFYLKKTDNVFSVTNPVFLLPILVILKKIKGFNLTLLVYDVFPENLQATNILTKDSFLYKILIKIYHWAYTNTDRCIVIGRDMETVIKQNTNQKVSTVYIPNWSNLTTIQPEEKTTNKIIKEYNLENKIVFSFVGNFGLVQNLEVILNSTLYITNENFLLLFIGDGAMKRNIEKFIEDHNSKNIIYAGKFPQEEQNTFLNACDVSIISLDSDMYGLGVPSKTYYNMGASKPLFFIGHEKSEIAQLINENNIGWNIATKNEIKLAEKIEQICQEYNNFKEKGSRAREVCLNQYNENVILERYKNLY